MSRSCADDSPHRPAVTRRDGWLMLVGVLRERIHTGCSSDRCRRVQCSGRGEVRTNRAPRVLMVDVKTCTIIEVERKPDSIVCAQMKTKKCRTNCSQVGPEKPTKTRLRWEEESLCALCVEKKSRE